MHLSCTVWHTKEFRLRLGWSIFQCFIIRLHNKFFCVCCRFMPPHRGSRPKIMTRHMFRYFSNQIVLILKRIKKYGSSSFLALKTLIWRYKTGLRQKLYIHDIAKLKRGLVLVSVDNNLSFDYDFFLQKLRIL